MKKLVALTLITILFGACSKEEIQNGAVINAMTSGFWRVVSFKEDTTVLTTNFTPYKFQFKVNLTVDAINGGSVETSGSWNANTTAETITSQFPNGNTTVKLLNGTWKITNNSWDFVEATQTVNGNVRMLRLEKF
jgi:hypothetical protein